MLFCNAPHTHTHTRMCKCVSWCVLLYIMYIERGWQTTHIHTIYIFKWFCISAWGREKKKFCIKFYLGICASWIFYKMNATLLLLPDGWNIVYMVYLYKEEGTSIYLFNRVRGSCRVSHTNPSTSHSAQIEIIYCWM